MKKYILFLFVIFAMEGHAESKNSIDKLKRNIPEYTKAFTEIYNNAIFDKSDYREMKKGVEIASTLLQVFDSKRAKMIIGLKGYKIAEKLRVVYPNKVAGYYYSALLLGLAAVYKGTQFVLYDIPKIEKWALKANELDPGLKNGAPANLLCGVYYEAPGFPISIWNLKKARKYCEFAMKNYPTNCTVYLYLAAIYDIDQGKDVAKQTLLKGKKHCKAPNDSLEEQVWLEKDLETLEWMLNRIDKGQSIRKFMENR